MRASAGLKEARVLHLYFDVSREAREEQNISHMHMQTRAQWGEEGQTADKPPEEQRRLPKHARSSGDGRHQKSKASASALRGRDVAAPRHTTSILQTNQSANDGLIARKLAA